MPGTVSRTTHRSRAFTLGNLTQTGDFEMTFKELRTLRVDLEDDPPWDDENIGGSTDGSDVEMLLASEINQTALQIHEEPEASLAAGLSLFVTSPQESCPTLCQSLGLQRASRGLQWLRATPFHTLSLIKSN